MSTAAAMTTDIHELSNRQAMFIGYFLCVLIDLTVLNLFDEYWDQIEIESFTTSLAAAALLQLLLKLTLNLEHRVANYFKQQQDKGALAKRLFTTWLILFGSKFVILEVINLVFGAGVKFGGVIPFIVVVFAIMAAELITSKIYGLLGDDKLLRNGSD